MSHSVVSQLTKIDGLRHLCFYDCTVSSDSSLSGGTFAQLDSLTMLGKDVQTSALANVQAPRLRSLHICAASIGDEMTQYINRFPHLKHLTVPRGQISADNMERLQKSLPDLRIEEAVRASPESGNAE